jgi:tetratricopeptide (TPR) repeat protein
MLAAAGLSAAPALMTSAHAQQKSAAPAAAPAAPQNTVRPDLFKLLDPAVVQPLMDAKNYAELQNRVTQAEAFPDKTPYETYVVNRMKLSLGSVTGNDALAIPALESVIESGFLPPAETGNFILALGNMHYNAKNYPKAIEWFQRYQKESGTPEKVQAALIRAYYLSEDYASAKTALLPAIAAAEKSGQKPSNEDLRLLHSSAHQVKDDATYLLALEKLAAYYPSDDYWADVLNRGVMRKPGFDAQNNMVNVLRLHFAAAKTMAADEYVDLAEQALRDGFPTEAKKVMDAGYAAGVLGKGANAKSHAALRDKANKGAADDAKNIASGEAAAAKSKKGAGLVNLGWAYVTMDQFDKGIGFIQQGIAKGGLKQPDEAKLRLGMAYARAGKKDEALKAFESVKAGGGLSDLAKYWTTLVNQQGGATATASAAQ